MPKPDRTFHVQYRYGYYAIDEYRGTTLIREVLVNIQSKSLAVAIAKNLTRAYVDGLWDQWENSLPAKPNTGRRCSDGN